MILQGVYTYCVGLEFVASCPGAGSPCYGGTNNAPSPWLSLYPRMHLVPSGLLVTAGQVPEIRTWNPSNGQWRGNRGHISKPVDWTKLLHTTAAPEFVLRKRQSADRRRFGYRWRSRDHVCSGRRFQPGNFLIDSCHTVSCVN